MQIFVSSWKASSTLLSDHRCECRESVAENRPPIARRTSRTPRSIGCLHIKYINHAILPIFAYRALSQAQRVLKSCGRLDRDTKLRFGVS